MIREGIEDGEGPQTVANRIARITGLQLGERYVSRRMRQLRKENS